jgi:adenylate cyclase class IV
MYEIEFKIEVNEEERERAISTFRERGFVFGKTSQQHNFHTAATKSPHGGYDLKRYRDEGDKITYTEKTWELAGEQLARKEVEREVSREEFELEMSKHPDALKIDKERQSFKTTYKDLDISLCIDSVKFDHSPSVRYFIEAETISSDKNKVGEYREIIIELLKDLLNKGELIEASGMFTMAFKKR